MKTYHPKKRLTFGEYVASVYKICGNKRARREIQRAVNAHLVLFLGRHPRGRGVETRVSTPTPAMEVEAL
jgi:hypothetical protein